MKAKRIVSLLLTCGMIFSLLTGCGNKAEADKESPVADSQVAEEVQVSDSAEEEKKEITFPLEEPVTMSIMVCGDETFLEDNSFYNKMEELTNVHWEYTVVPYGELEEKRNILINSGDYADVFFRAGLSEELQLQLSEEGIIIPLEDLIEEYAPNYKALADKKDLWKLGAIGEEGHTYTLFEVYDPNNSFGPVPMWINATWLDNLGLDKPESLDELYDVLKAFKEQDADGDGDPNNEIPFMMANDLDGYENWMNYFGLPIQDWCTMFGFDRANDEMLYYPTTENWKECLAYMEKLYADGLLFSECFTTGVEQLRSYGQGGTMAYGAYFEWSPSNATGYSYQGGKDGEYVLVDFFDEGMISTSSACYGGTFAITDACEYPEIAMAWVDYLYTVEGNMLAYAGEEGVTWEMIDDDTWDYIYDSPFGDNIHAATGAMGVLGLSLPTCISDFHQNHAYVDLEMNPYATLVKDERARVIADQGSFVWPTIKYTAEETARIAEINADLDVYWRQYVANVVVGKTDLDATWEEYLQECEKMGSKEYQEIENAAYARSK